MTRHLLAALLRRCAGWLEPSYGDSEVVRSTAGKVALSELHWSWTLLSDKETEIKRLQSVIETMLLERQNAA